METEKILDLVRQMRTAQKEYFRIRDKRIMQRSIILEKLVDEELENIQTNNKKKDTQLSLF